MTIHSAPDPLRSGRYYAAKAIENARRTIYLAECRCLPFGRLVERVQEMASVGVSSETVYVILERDRTPESGQGTSQCNPSGVTSNRRHQEYR